MTCSDVTSVSHDVDERTPHHLTPQQARHFDAFGYVVVKGLLADDIDQISQAFDAVMANPEVGAAQLQYDEGAESDRVMVPSVLDCHPDLVAIKSDPRLIGIVESLIGPDWGYAESDGNILNCETTWHRDTYGAPLKQFHLKLLFYLDPLVADTGALRVIPGTQFHGQSFVKAVLAGHGFPDRMHETFGVTSADVPSTALATEPGDAIVLNFRTLHASFNGRPDRRLFTVNYKEPGEPPT